MTHKKTRRALLTGLIASAILTPALAQPIAGYPTKPIELIVAYGPGGGTDLVARLLARHLEKQLGASIVVVNRPGAGGSIGFSELARAKPDGYTIGFINTPNVLTIPIERKSAFHWSKYDLLGNLVDDPGAFAIHNSNSITTLAGLASYAKANPGSVTVGTTGTGSDDHLAMLMFERATGTQLSHVPYKGAGEVRAAVTGQQIMIAAMNVGEVLAYQKAGTPIRLLGQMAKERSSLAQQVPTFSEQRIPIELASLRGLAAPKGLPEPLRNKLVDAVAAIAADPAFKQQAEAMFAPLRYLPPEAYAAELKSTEAEFKKLWGDMPWQDKP